MADTIGPFRDKYDFLSNFYPRTIEWKLKNGETIVGISEKIYQVEKFRDPIDAYYLLALTPGQAKREANKYKDLWKSNWHDIKTEVMLRIIREKFNQHTDLADKLIETKETEIVEFNVWHDNFWGDCTCPRCAKIEGMNHLGRILMWVRKELAKANKDTIGFLEWQSERGNI